MSSLDRTRLQNTTINALDLVLLLMNLTVEVVGAVSPNSKAADEQLTEIANKLNEFARKITNPKMHLLMMQLSVALIATERTA